MTTIRDHTLQQQSASYARDRQTCKDTANALDAVAHGTARVERLPRVLVIREEDRVAGARPQRERFTAMARERRRAAERRSLADEQHRRHAPARLRAGALTGHDDELWAIPSVATDLTSSDDHPRLGHGQLLEGELRYLSPALRCPVV